MAGEHSWKELNEQSQTWRDGLANSVRPFPLPGANGELLFMGSGIALYVAEALARVAERATGIVARALPAQEAFSGAQHLAKRPRTTIIVSRTGDVTDAVRAARAAREAGVAGRLVAFLGESGGPLTEVVDDVYQCDVEEQSVATTKTLTTMLLVGTANLFAAGGHEKMAAALTKVGPVLEQAMPAFNEVAEQQVAEGFRQVVFMGTGARYGVARAAALTAREMALLDTHGNHTLVFPHGHKVTLDERSLCVFFLSRRDRQDELAVVAEARRMGARTVLIGSELQSGTESAHAGVDLGPPLDDDATLPLMMVLPQLLGYHAALAKGLDPDHPRELTKVF